MMNCYLRNQTEKCYVGLDEYESDEDLAQVSVLSNYPKSLLKFTAACCFIFMVLGILGNTATIVALSKHRKIRNATAIFIINLSISDLLFSILIFPIAISLFLNQSWTTGKVMCRIFPTINYGLTATSVFSIVAITINRYIMVTHPILYPRIYQKRNLIIMVIAIWTGAFLMEVPMLFEIYGRFSLDRNVGFCTVIPDKNNNNPKYAIIIMGFVFPCTIIFACYGRILYVVKKSSVKTASNATTSNVPNDSTSKNKDISTRELTSSSNTQEEYDINCDDVENNGGVLKKLRKNFKATFRRKERRMSDGPTRRDKRLRSMILCIVIGFFACHLPIIISYSYIGEESDMHPYGNIVGYISLYVSGCINPITYVVMSKEYRQAYRSIYKYLIKR